MSQQPYAIENLMEQTRKLAAHYYAATQQVLPVSGELARFDACALLSLTLNNTPSEGVDAFDAQQQGVQVKSRVLFREDGRGYRIGQIHLDGLWQTLLLVLYNPDYQPIRIYQLTREHVMAALDSADNPKRDKRGAMSIAKFKAIGECVWPRDDIT